MRIDSTPSLVYSVKIRPLARSSSSCQMPRPFSCPVSSFKRIPEAVFPDLETNPWCFAKVMLGLKDTPTRHLSSTDRKQFCSIWDTLPKQKLQRRKEAVYVQLMMTQIRCISPFPSLSSPFLLPLSLPPPFPNKMQ